ncbi:related to transcription activator protein acu-15 [Cephalotrichum gorgonifer]|uniref:Related to transcription activator protein acu-15 n=1 Tax=Cephalotrichum gorgonifer TaxID=2041049 RepID=A0AAE8N986_9PEZI|nr:related to transcription activator protein acu-15 [Cephalotrichum gorgonifer]
MAAAPSPYTGSEPTTFSPGHSTSSISLKRKRGVSHSLPEPAVREIGLMRDAGETDTARFVGSSSGIHFIRNVHMRLARQSATRTQYIRGVGDGVGDDDSRGQRIGELIPGEDDQLRGRATGRDDERAYLWKDHEVSTHDGPTPSFDQLVEWSESYFKSWHPILPFLHAPDVLRSFEYVSQAGISSLDHLDRCILRSVLSISLADSRQGVPLKSQIPSSLLFGSVDEAISSSQFALCQPASIGAIQAALSIQLFLTSMLCLNAASRLGGLVVRMSFHLGLHRCPTRFPFFTPERAALRRRVFWCIYICERYLCQSLGLPLDIQDDDVDVCYPGEEQHASGPHDEGNDKRLQMLTYTAKHAKIRGQILELRNKSIWTRQDTADRALVVQTELSRWSNDIQDMIEEADFADETDDDDDDTHTRLAPSHRLVLLLSKYESLICLNRPMMASDASMPSWSAAMQACISAAKSICITMKRYASKNKRAGDQAGRTLTSPMLWPSFTWAAWISAFILAYAAIEKQMPLESALRYIESSKDILRHIASRNTSWPEYCLSAIDELTSAVKEMSSARDTAWNHLQNEIPQPAAQSSDDLARPLARSRTRGQVSISNLPAHEVQGGPGQSNHSNFTPAVASSSGLVGEAETQTLPADSFPPQASEWPRGGGIAPPNVARHHNGPASPSQAQVRATAAPWNYQHAFPHVGNGQSAAAVQYHTVEAGMDSVPGNEGQESMMWYDQLFDKSFSAIDNPFLAAAQFDPAIDPTWSYLR